MAARRKITGHRFKDRRKSADRRNGLDRRSNNHLDSRKSSLIFNTRQACSYLQISRPTYLKFIASGKIKAKKIGRGWKVFKNELDRFAREH